MANSQDQHYKSVEYVEYCINKLYSSPLFVYVRTRSKCVEKKAPRKGKTKKKNTVHSELGDTVRQTVGKKGKKKNKNKEKKGKAGRKAR